ncbi:MAG: hypothetical protein A3C88_01310 [Candidatus Yanofskybacteria bacterium RIFCSPHIGHO2_02_FULL_50_12]|uniref:RNA polymerase sigma factor 70 region 4 type 2 domain-containing protein n=1 Tax=Candidatus Yanofskybacteria bacterium RIFCSPHIGHO2_02_FULL_50_12 TaxID=1802685 RepID=A0A1F8FXG3_9BACT|nr:MAG: hypothetical protein A3C88_01310 [Candidatus Yanofskybacteria bacterium RIFCSPHIGHO2_02_FULL_50_12]
MRLLTSRNVRREDYEDIWQEAILAAWNSIQQDKFPGEIKLGGWFIGIFQHKATDYFRRRSRALKFETPTPNAYLEDLTSRILISEALQKLSKSRREVICLHLQGFSTSEIATKLNRSPGRTGALLWEAKKQLRKLVK